MRDAPQPYRMMIAAASWLVPAPGRDEWRQEWLAEIQARLDDLNRWNRLSLIASLALALRCLGALMDAAYLRLQSLKQGFWGDVRFGVRLLVKSPGFALSAFIALALGIGANTALFSAVNALLWRTPNVHDPDALVAIYTADYSSTRFGVSSFPDYHDLANESRTLASVAAFIDGDLRAQFGEELEQIEAGFVSASYWRTLGVRPIAGRVIEDDLEIGAVISEALWERRFARSPGVLGQPITLNGNRYPIYGIMPRSFSGTHLMARPNVWVPLRRIVDLLGGSESQFLDRRSRSLSLIARLAPNVTIQRAQTELEVLARRLAASDARAWTDVRGKQRAMTALPLKEAGFDPDARQAASRVAALAFGVIGTLLVIVCATVATMLLARAQARRKEMAVRLSMGAERLRLLRQLLTESGLLCLAGGLGGILLARWSFDWLNRTPELWMGLSGVELKIEPAVMAYAAAIILASTVLAGIAPALRASRQNLISDLKDDCAPMNARLDRSRAASVFVAGQVALSLILLMAGALLVRSLRNMQSAYPGFASKGILLATLETGSRPATPQQAFGFVRNLQERLASIAGLNQVALSGRAFLIDRFGRRSVPVEGYQYAPGETHEFHVQFATPGYFATLGIPILQGRDFSWRDGPDAPRVAIVNEVFARKFWPNRSPIGSRLPFSRGITEVIGVVAPVKFHGVSDPPMPMFFLPLTQEPQGALRVYMKANEASDAIAPVLRQKLRELDRQLFTSSVIGYSEAIARKALPERAATTLVAVAGLLALFLAALGLYGVISHAVSQSTREIGIRLAVGASRSDILRHVFNRAARLFLPGAGIGVVGAFLFSRLLERWLFGVAPYDLLSMLSVLALLVAVSGLATWLPTRRALRIAPLEALRYQ